jgi:hypothetical protein
MTHRGYTDPDFMLPQEMEKKKWMEVYRQARAEEKAREAA